MAFTRLHSLLFLAIFYVHIANATYHAKGFKCPGGQVTAYAACCKLFPIIERMQEDLFEGAECGEDAHSALRLAFHDAIGFSVHGKKGNGADGSILIFNRTELRYDANDGVDEITARQYPIFAKSGLSAGDFVHLAAAVGTANCPGAPRLKYMLGRPPPRVPAPDGTVPEPTDSVTSILERFADAGFNAKEVVALLASHSIAAADALDPTIPGTPFDTTVGTMDTQVFLEVLLKGKLYPGNGSQPGEVLSPIAGEMRLESDFRIARDHRTACFWQDMINDQKSMMTQFKDAMAKLQVLGQPRNLIDCSDVIPVPKPFAGPIKYPASFSEKDVQKSCPHPFPRISTVSGPAPTVTPVTN